MSKQTYAEKLRDPRWQRKRLEVMQAAEWMCECCNTKSKTLSVHHREYFKGREPWEYEHDQLACLCQECHSALHAQPDLYRLAGSLAKVEGGPWDRESLGLVACGFVWAGEDRVCRELQRQMTDYEEVAYLIGMLAQLLVRSTPKQLRAAFALSYGDDELVLHQLDEALTLREERMKAWQANAES